MKIADLKKYFPDFYYRMGREDTFERIEIDSRKVRKGDMFVAIRGTNIDSHRFIKDAVKSGASVIVSEIDIDLPENVSLIKVPNSRTAYALFSSAFYGFPSKKVKVIGITGTSGKSTTAYLMYRFFNDFLRIPSGFIGTIGIDSGRGCEFKERFPPTTPDALELNAMLRDAANHRLKYVFTEVSSSAMLFKRIEGIEFYGKILTNIGTDHLEVHGTFQNYLRSKLEFFKGKNRISILNADSEYFELFEKSTFAEQTFTYGINNPSDFGATLNKIEADFSDFSVSIDGKKQHFVLRLPGIFNVYNFLALIAFSAFEGISPSELVRFASSPPSIPGRMNTVPLESGARVVIDFAHNPMEIESILRFLNSVKGNSKLITVTGAVGKSLKSKRENIGRVADSLSDILIITTDDPRGDDVQRILKDVSRFAHSAIVIEDREEAIRRALEIAKKGDIIAILGRGEEREIHFKDRVFEKSDLEMVKEIENENK